MTRWKSKIRIRMMLSCIAVSVAAVLFLEILCASIVFFIVVFSPGYAQPEVSTRAFFTNFAAGFLPPALGILLITIPVSAAFSLMTMRRQLGRMQRLIDATAQFVAGDYKQRVQVMSKDEFGLLEQQFNLMGEQLVESIQQGHMLTEHNARLA